MAEADYSAPAGMVTLRPGDVLVVAGAMCIAVTVNDCRAVMEPLERVRREVKPRFGEEGETVNFDAPGKQKGISVHCEPGDVLERRGAKGVEEFLAARKARRGKGGEAGLETTNDGQQKENDMGSKLRKLKGETKRKARGGLAADGAVETKAPRKGGLGEIYGYSVASVMRRLGKEGIKGNQAMLILEAQKIKASKPGVQTMLFNGRHGVGGDPAPLTAEQVKQLIASAPEPVKEEEKAEDKK
jgi:hypothetical protein